VGNELCVIIIANENGLSGLWCNSYRVRFDFAFLSRSFKSCNVLKGFIFHTEYFDYTEASEKSK
jgi:hypothetical protein